jgi:hypothetical protein
MTELNEQELQALKKIAQEYIEKEKDTSIESLIEVAKEYKKLALEKYPKDKCEVYVDEDSKNVVIKFPDSDSYWDRIKVTQLIIARLNSKSVKKDTNRRIYV